MQQEKWIKWKPIERIPNTLYIEELKDTRDGLTIVMTREDNILPSLTVNTSEGALVPIPILSFEVSIINASLLSVPP